MVKRFVILIISIGMLSLSTSCYDPPPPRLSKAMVKQLDSIFVASRDSLDSIAMVICDEKFTSIYQGAIDSIQQMRMEEIESILGQ